MLNVPDVVKPWKGVIFSHFYFYCCIFKLTYLNCFDFDGAMIDALLAWYLLHLETVIIKIYKWNFSDKSLFQVFMSGISKKFLKLILCQLLWELTFSESWPRKERNVLETTLWNRIALLHPYFVNQWRHLFFRTILQFYNFCTISHWSFANSVRFVLFFFSLYFLVNNRFY